jgi:hypothetical protein
MTFNEEWEEFLLKASQHFKVMANLEFLMFVMGIQELGQGYKAYSKQEKTDLIALAQCKLMSMSGYTSENGRDIDGWPLYEVLIDEKELAPSSKDQLLKKNLILYFEPVINQ